MGTTLEEIVNDESCKPELFSVRTVTSPFSLLESAPVSDIWRVASQSHDRGRLLSVASHHSFKI